MKNTILTIAIAVGMVGLFQARSQSDTEAKAYQIDGVHSTVLFKVSHMGISNTWGRFDSIAGDLKFGDGASGNAINVTVKADSINTGNAGRDKHLRGPDFFSAKEFPTIAFKSKSWKNTGGMNYDVSGDLTLHGVTKAVTIAVTKVGEGKGPRGKDRVGFDGLLKLKRTDFGMTKLVGPAGDEVTLHLAIEGMR